MMQAAQSRHSNNLARCARVRPSRASGRWPRPLAFGDRGWKPLYNWTISSYAPDGDVLAMTDLVMGGWTYTYDDMNRLTSGTAASGVDEGLTLGWNYDRYGNRWDQSVTGTGNATAVSPQLSFTGNNNRIDGWSYDAAGNLLYDQIHHYTYDAENRVATVDGQQAYIYDAEGIRVAKLGSGGAVTASYVLGLGGEQVSEVNGSGVWVHSNVFVGGRLMATYAGSGDTAKQGYHYHLTDWLGTQRMQTSASGNEEERCYSYPFGDGLSCTGADATEHHFTGKERDQESGNDYFGARYYASTMGRWMSPDPSPAGVNVMNPQSWNLYNYALNNPLRMVDRNGYWATDIHAQIVTYSLQNYVSSGELNVLRARQYSMDADQSDQNRHSMANTGQSSQDALNGMWNYVRDEMNIVTSSTVGSGNSLNITGVNALGDAIHTLEDYTSPMHTDHAFMPMEWDGGTWPPSKWGPGLNHVLGEQSPDQDWSRIGLAVRLTMAAYLQSGEGCQSGKRCLTADNFEYEFQQNMTEYVNNFYATHNAGASSEAQKDAARQCALGNPAACD